MRIRGTNIITWLQLDVLIFIVCSQIRMQLSTMAELVDNTFCVLLFELRSTNLANKMVWNSL